MVIEEKMDGKLSYFRWNDYHIFAEDLSIRHTIPYRVPARYALFDVQLGDEYLSRDDMVDFYLRLRKSSEFLINVETKDKVSIFNFFIVPELSRGLFEMKDLPGFLSMYSYYSEGELIEGVVVKPLLTRFITEPTGKLVREEFVSGITQSYLRSLLIPNKIDPSRRILLRYPDVFLDWKSIYMT
ncbi:MAG: hypothetical protein ACTSVF_01355 [Candidatus Asgardarchaeia archaeon]